MRQRITLLLLAALLTFSWPVSGYAQINNTDSSAREQAIAHLTQHKTTYGIELTDLQEEEVQNTCRSIQANTIQVLRNETEPLKQKYLTVTSSMDSTIKFTANSLNQMSEDSSNMDLASVHLTTFRENFDSSIDVYSKSLDELLVIDCQIFADLFVAGLEEARFRRRLVLAAAEDIVEFRDVELKRAFEASLERLREVEARL